MHKVELMENLVCILKTYQILIAGIVGFTGVVVTMLANGYLQRAQHNRAIEHDKQALRSALKAELNANKQAYEHRIEQFSEPSSDKDALMQNNVQDQVYNTLLDKIGILEPGEIKKIIEAYQLINEVPYRTRILVGTDAIGGFENEYIRLKPHHIDIVKKIHEALLPTIMAAIESIDEHAKNA
ncbi:hypothetical protein [Methylophaga sp.]|uniref:hypothetical protein n=1 Tax=Methylophaga sp. TaxID=2024840 RepID=UPI0025E502E4|nr:hypothetical protein [Methylophaga sp.]